MPELWLNDIDVLPWYIVELSYHDCSEQFVNMMSRRPLAAFALSVCSVNAAFNLLNGFDATIQYNFGISEKCMKAMYVRTISKFANTYL